MSLLWCPYPLAPWPQVALSLGNHLKEHCVPQVRVVRRRLALELRHSVDDLFLVYLGRMLKDEEVLPEECFHCRRFNFVRWLDGKGIDR